MIRFNRKKKGTPLKRPCLLSTTLDFPVAEILEHGKPHVAALFLMELGSHEIASAHNSLERLRAVSRLGEGVFRGHQRVVRMHVIEIATAADPLHYRVFAGKVHLVPSHMRNLETGFVLEAHGLARDKPKRLHATVFFAFLKNNLASDTNAEHRVAGLHHHLDGITDSRSGQRFHGRRRGTDTGENQPRRLRDFICIPAGLRIHADMRERIHHRREISGIVVDHNYGISGHWNLLRTKGNLPTPAA